MTLNNKFPTWLTANIMIPRIIRGNIKERATMSNRLIGDIDISLVDSEANRYLIPDELKKDFELQLKIASYNALDKIGVNFEELIKLYYKKSITDELLSNMESDIIKSIYKYEMNTRDSIENVIIELLGTDPCRAVLIE